MSYLETRLGVALADIDADRLAVTVPVAEARTYLRPDAGPDEESGVQ